MIKNIPDLKEKIEKIPGLIYDLPFAENDPIVKNLQLYPNSLIGKGGFGKVEKAFSFDDKNNRYEIAKKTIVNPNLKFIIEEISMLLSVSTIKYYNAYYEDNDIVILIELLEGVDGAQLLKKDCILNKEGSKKLLIYLLELRNCMDAKGVVHRDIKPHNIIFESNELSFGKSINFQKCTVIDWGLGCSYYDINIFKTCYLNKNGTKDYWCPIIDDVIFSNIPNLLKVLKYLMVCLDNLYFGSRDDMTIYKNEIDAILKNPTLDNLVKIIKSPVMSSIILSYIDLWSIAATVFEMSTNIRYKTSNDPDKLNVFKLNSNPIVYEIVMDILNYPSKGCKNSSTYLSKLNIDDNKITSCQKLSNNYKNFNIHNVSEWRKFEQWGKYKYTSNGVIQNIFNSMTKKPNPEALFVKKYKVLVLCADDNSVKSLKSKQIIDNIFGNKIYTYTYIGNKLKSDDNNISGDLNKITLIKKYDIIINEYCPIISFGVKESTLKNIYLNNLNIDGYIITPKTFVDFTIFYNENFELIEINENMSKDFRVYKNSIIKKIIKSLNIEPNSKALFNI